MQSTEKRFTAKRKQEEKVKSKHPLTFQQETMEGEKRQQYICNDEISQLSDDILISILSRIQLKEAARSSILSKRWRYLWNCVPHLQLDGHLVDGPGSSSWIDRDEYKRYLEVPDRKRRKWTSIVHKILHSRRAPTQSCSIYNCMEKSKGWPDEFMELLSTSGIRRLYIHDFMGQYQFPPNGFCWQSLKKLTLSSCKVTLPHFQGMSYLTSLKLFGVLITDNDLEKLISSCLKLESFFFDEVGFGAERKLKEIRISAPCLMTLWICSQNPIQITFNGASILKYVYLWFDMSYDTKKVVKLLMDLHHVESFQLGLPYKSSKCMPRSLPAGYQFLKLKQLTLDVWGDISSFMSCLLRSSPSLEELNVISQFSNEGYFDRKYWETQSPSEGSMNKLTTVRIKLTNLNSWCAIGFMKFLLLNACFLKRMIIENRGNGPFEGASELLLLKRASPDAVLEIKQFEVGRILISSDDDPVKDLV